MTDDCPEHECGRLRLHNDLQRAFSASLIHPNWPAPRGVYAVTTTRAGPEPSQCTAYGFNVGTRCGDDSSQVARNRLFLHDTLALPSEPAWLRQVHGTRVVELDSPHPSPPPQAGEGDGRAARSGEAHPPRVVRTAECTAPSGCSPLPLAGEGSPRAARTGEGNGALRPPEPEADAAVTRAPGVVLAIQTADCLPVLFCATGGSEIAAAHAGWRGLAAGVLENTVGAMQAPRDQIFAWLGPAIAAKSYEVGDEVRAAFVADNPIAMTGFKPSRQGHWWCDLYQLARVRLRATGVTQIFGGGLDTFTDPRLHSYRRDGAASGRMASLVWMLPRMD